MITLPKLKQKTLTLFSKLIKLRHAQNGIIRCYTGGAVIDLGSSNCQAGHYLTRGAYPSLTFHPDNCRPQCFRCNIHLHGNTVEFRERLINELGLEKVEQLESSRHESKKFSRGEYEEMIRNYKDEIKQLEDACISCL